MRVGFGSHKLFLTANSKSGGMGVEGERKGVQRENQREKGEVLRFWWVLFFFPLLHRVVPLHLEDINQKQKDLNKLKPRTLKVFGA